MKTAIKTLLCGAAATMMLAFPAPTQAAAELDNLLNEVRKARTEQQRVNQQREAEFRNARNRQQQLLADARRQRDEQEAISANLQAQFDANEVTLTELSETLNARAGNLGEIFGVVRQSANDFVGELDASLVSAEYPGRVEFMEKLADAKQLPKFDELRQFYETLLQEMIEQGKTTSFSADVVNREGKTEQRNVTRVGVFNVISDDEYLNYREGFISELQAQPAARYTSLVDDFSSAGGGYERFAIDPSKGQVLELERQKKGWLERYHDGGIVGYVVTGILVLGLLIGLYKLFVLNFVTGPAVSRQAKSSTPGNNPLGRIMKVYLANKDDDTENLELKLDEAVLKETPKIESGITFVKVLAAIGPLMGLLGTVTGMIETFQAITIYGTGDPGVMAGGISAALVTTVLGLVTAIPLTFLHAIIAGKSRNIIHVLEEQSTGLIAQHEESGTVRAGA